MAKSYLDIIVVVTNDLNSDQRMHRICDSFLNNGKSVLLLGHQKRDSSPIINQNFKQQRLKTFFRKGPLFYLEFNIKVLFTLLFSSYRILYSVDLDTLLASGLASIVRRKTLIYDSHEFFTELPELQGKPIKKCIWNLIGKLFIPKADYCISVGQKLSNVLSQKYRSEFIPIYNFPKFRNIDISKSISKRKVVLYQGKVNVKRGLEEMIQALEYLQNIELWIVGDGDILENIRIQANNSIAVDRIKIMGWYSPDDLAAITPLADIGINLLHGDSDNYYFSAANKVYDYVMAGVPCLTMDFPEHQILNESHNVLYLLNELEPKKIAFKIQEIFSNKNLYRKKIENCIKAREVLNWENECQKLLRLI